MLTTLCEPGNLGSIGAKCGLGVVTKDGLTDGPMKGLSDTLKYPVGPIKTGAARAVMLANSENVTPSRRDLFIFICSVTPIYSSLMSAGHIDATRLLTDWC